jgi:hypothetical protein
VSGLICHPSCPLRYFHAVRRRSHVNASCIDLSLQPRPHQHPAVVTIRITRTVHALRFRLSRSSSLAALAQDRACTYIAVCSMVHTGLFAALLLASLACASAFDFAELPDALLETLKDQVGSLVSAWSRDVTGSRHLACHVHSKRDAACRSRLLRATGFLNG